MIWLFVLSILPETWKNFVRISTIFALCKKIEILTKFLILTVQKRQTTFRKSQKNFVIIVSRIRQVLVEGLWLLNVSNKFPDQRRLSNRRAMTVMLRGTPCKDKKLCLIGILRLKGCWTELLYLRTLCTPLAVLKDLHSNDPHSFLISILSPWLRAGACIFLCEDWFECRLLEP